LLLVNFRDYNKIILINITFYAVNLLRYNGLLLIKEAILVGLLNETVSWWHWIVLGLVLLMVEMSTGTFVILGLGVAAILVGALDYFMALSFTSEVIIWAVLSILSFMAWKRWMKVEHVSSTGQSDYSIGTQGTVTEDIDPHNRGKVTFDISVLGNTSWTATSTQSISKDARVKIVEIHGQLIEVENI
jgi:membrane protein implicated in regulation of membrane protease activity